MIPAGINHVKINREYIKKLSAPFNPCVKQDNMYKVSRMFQYFQQNNYTYYQKDCMNLCIVAFAMKQCNCSLVGDDFNFEPCSHDPFIADCFGEYYEDFLNRKISEPTVCQQECPPECDTVSFNLQHNSFYATDKFLEINNDTKSLNESKDDLIYLFIYYPDKKYVMISQIPRMQTFDLGIYVI